MEKQEATKFLKPDVSSPKSCSVKIIFISAYLHESGLDLSKP